MEDDVVKDLSEFALANALFAALVEGHAAETNARCVVTNQLTRDATEFISSDETPWTTPPRTLPT
jgi:F-type H+-transporting ATPase subunit gamma